MLVETPSPKICHKTKWQIFVDDVEFSVKCNFNFFKPSISSRLEVDWGPSQMTSAKVGFYVSILMD